MDATLERSSAVRENRILASLPEAERARLRPHLQRVRLAAGQALHTCGGIVDMIYLPTEGLVSLVAEPADSAPTEVGIIGREGLVGLGALLTAEPVAPYKALVQVSGGAYRIPCNTLCAELEALPTFRRQAARYAAALLVQVGQTAACNGRHALSARCARWLLMAHDRLDGDLIPLTHDFLAMMLSVRRAGVTVASGSLQAAGLVSLSRGRIAVRDREGLEGAACSCYRVVRRYCEQIGVG